MPKSRNGSFLSQPTAKKSISMPAFKTEIISFSVKNLPDFQLNSISNITMICGSSPCPDNSAAVSISPTPSVSSSTKLCAKTARFGEQEFVLRLFALLRLVRPTGAKISRFFRKGLLMGKQNIFEKKDEFDFPVMETGASGENVSA